MMGCRTKVLLRKALTGDRHENVQQRVRLHYGAAFGIQVYSELGRGTDVILSLPLLEQELIGLPE